MQNIHRYRVCKRAIIVNSLINSLLASTKMTLGFLGNSQALFADGVHSLSDLIADVLVLFAAKFGTQAPDREHPYGHQRIETLVTLVVWLIILTVAVGIGYDSIHRITSHARSEQPDLIVVVIAMVSITVNECLYRYILHLGNKIDSDLLRSNAWHNRTDALVSTIVLASVVGALLGANFLDAIGGVVIAALILKMSSKMIYKSLRELIDTGAEETLINAITETIKAVPSVISVHQLRTRSHGNNLFVDVHVQVPPTISISEGHHISEQVGINLVKAFKAVIDVTVHIDPEDDEKALLSQELPDRRKIEADLTRCWHTLEHHTLIEKITLHYLDGKVQADVYFPVCLANKEDIQTVAENYQTAASKLSYISSIKLFLTVT